MLRFIVDLFSTPALVIGLVALIGLLAQRKSLNDVVNGTLKATLGFVIIGGGAGIIVQALTPIQEMLLRAFKLEGFVPFDELVVAGVAAQLGRETALILAFGFLINLLLARVTPWKYVYLTGHMLWIHAGAWAILLHSMGIQGAANIAIGAVIQGLYTTFFPALAQPIMRRITDNDQIAFGHGQTFLAVAGAHIARLFGRPEDSAESIRVSDRWVVLRDMAVSMSLIMTAVSLIAALYAGQSFVEAELSQGKNYIIFALLQALTFTGGVLVLMQGVRMFISEIVPAFQGISERLVPGARPALDCPVIYPYAPNSLMIGLITGTVAQALVIPLIIALKWPVPIPSMIVAFFASGTGAIFGNALAGRRGALFGGFFWSFAGFLLSSWAYATRLFGDLNALGASGVGFVVPDAIVIAAAVKFLFGLAGIGG
ncbi:putative sugar-specific permease SgaT/UlaA [Thermaerobacter marianensis DSM 12885]|uniref:Ascorbate-specific PTS system EIIC component n=1 Tax=Thermaerobacter marianensis (strain ATCC 700841 / DSM 12885 / JCM 10246 / 7p75a) TaxID=644966 RepID=E6SID7_THEM7|nr:PTS ascorbate transporter subunit IIC [Thermaerobacter marianensis]ADU51948.1 putative sugar-specific permease SgaT/UlaA [Thermaerobacter marianensis DSM 12885]